MQFIPRKAKYFSKKIISPLKEELPYPAVLELDGVVAASTGDKDAKVLAAPYGAVGLDYCWAGDGSASDDYYSHRNPSVVADGAGGPPAAQPPPLPSPKHPPLTPN